MDGGGVHYQVMAFCLENAPSVRAKSLRACVCVCVCVYLCVCVWKQRETDTYYLYHQTHWRIPK